MCFGVLPHLSRPFQIPFGRILRQLARRYLVFLFVRLGYVFFFHINSQRTFLFSDRWVFPGSSLGIDSVRVWLTDSKIKLLLFPSFLVALRPHPMYDEIRESSHPLPVSLFSAVGAILEPPRISLLAASACSICSRLTISWGSTICCRREFVWAFALARFFFLLRHGSKKFSAKDGPHIQAVKVVGWNGAVQRIAAAHTICPCALFKRQAQRPHAQQPLPYTHQCGRRKRLNRWEKEEHSKRFSSLQFSQRKQLDVPVEISRFLRKKNSPR